MRSSSLLIAKSFSDRAPNPVKIAQKFTPGFGPNVLGVKSPAGKILKPKY